MTRTLPQRATARDLLELMLGGEHAMHSIASCVSKQENPVICVCTCGMGFKVKATKENLNALRHVLSDPDLTPLRPRRRKIES